MLANKVSPGPGDYDQDTYDMAKKIQRISSAKPQRILKQQNSFEQLSRTQ